MKNNRISPLRFNFGFLLEANLGSSREIELDYPTVQVSEDLVLTPLQGVFQATRTSKGIYVTGQIHSTVSIDCARCLEPAVLPYLIELDDLFYSPASEAPPGEFTIGDDGFLDLGPLVRDLVFLELPLQRYCRPDCLGLCPECGQNLNEATCDCIKQDTDHRLEALRSLLDSD